MRKLSVLFILITVITFFVGCKDKGSKPISTISQDKLEDETAGDSTIFGTMVDGGMNSLILLTDKGDTVEYLVHPDDTIEVVKGGKITGDRFALIGYTEYGDHFMRSAINVTSLLGNWTSLDRDFELKEGGKVTSNLQTESDPWTSWKIYNGKLVLSKDTFTVNQLGADSLMLENKNGIFVYKRGK